MKLGVCVCVEGGRGEETIHLHVVLPRFKNEWSYNSTPTYTFMGTLKVKVVPVHRHKVHVAPSVLNLVARWR